MEYEVHFFARLTDTLRSVYSVRVGGANIDEVRATATAMLRDIPGAMGFRVCDRAGRQLDMYVPVDGLGPLG